MNDENPAPGRAPESRNVAGQATQTEDNEKVRQSPEPADPGPIVHLHEIDPRYLIELGLLRLEITRRAAERRITRAAELLDKPALGWYRRHAQGPAS